MKTISIFGLMAILLLSAANAAILTTQDAIVKDAYVRKFGTQTFDNFDLNFTQIGFGNARTFTAINITGIETPYFVRKAELCYYVLAAVEPSEVGVNSNVSIHTCGDFTENAVTFNNFFGAGADFYASPGSCNTSSEFIIPSTQIAAREATLCFNITNRYLYEQTSDNYSAFLFRFTDDATPYGSAEMQFYSSENTDNTSARPFLSLEYCSPNFQCSGWNPCSNDFKQCQSIIDSNNCDETFTGNINDYNIQCLGIESSLTESGTGMAVFLDNVRNPLIKTIAIFGIIAGILALGFVLINLMINHMNKIQR